MTNEEKSRRIAKFCGKGNLFFLKKCGLYYRPGASGYTDNTSEAWTLTEEEADKHVYPYDEPVTKHPAPLPDYFGDWNAIHEEKNNLTPIQKIQFANSLCDLFGLDEDYYTDRVNIGDRVYSLNSYLVFLISNSIPAQYAEAFGLAFELWK